MSESITVDVQTTKLKLNQTHTFRVRFNELEPCGLRFELAGIVMIDLHQPNMQH